MYRIDSVLLRRVGIFPTLLLAFGLLLCPLCAQTASSMGTGHGVIAEGAGPWWKHAVFYEIYPRSFQDTNGDGTGDLKGITEHLGYLERLGVDAIWIAPMFPSPQVDFGYDISDYKTVDPQYGTLADMDQLIAEARKHHIRVLLDMVLNHTSDQNAWFKESRSSRTNPKRDWYVWADGTGPNKANPPNNWESLFGHSAWKFDPTTKQFYYHKFYAEQPDLNWRNPTVEKAMFDVLRFWLDRGVAGFRLDAIPTLFENTDMKDETPLLDANGKTSRNAYGDLRLHDTQTSNLTEVHDVLRRMRILIDSYPGNRVLIGETYFESVADLDRTYGGAKKDELQLPMDFQVGMLNKLDVAAFRRNIDDVETKIHGSQPLFVFDNHDNARADRYCTTASAGIMPDRVQCLAIQKMLATLLFTSRATALMYYGDEIGMATTPPTRKEDVKDPIGILGWPAEKGRDGDRTPMQWTSGANAGFTTGQMTWLPIPVSHREMNVASERGDSHSLLSWYTDLTSLRRENSALRDGSMTMVDTTNNKVLSFVRRTSKDKAVGVAMNFTATPQVLTIDRFGAASATTLLTTADSGRSGKVKQFTLAPYGSWIGEIH